VLDSGASAGAIASAFGAFHSAYKGCFLQQAITAHPATEKGAFDGLFGIDENSLTNGLFFER